MAEPLVPLTLREPARGSLWDAEVLEMSGLEMLRAYLDRRLPDPPASRLTGLRLSEASLGAASASMPASPWWQSGAGVFLAGTLGVAADLPLSAAVLTSAPPGTAITTSELSINFLRTPTIRSERIVARARLIHATKSLGLSEATIEDGRGRLLAHATSRCVLVRLERDMMRSLASDDGGEPSSPDPYQRPVEGDVRGREFWDANAGIDTVGMVVRHEFVPPCFLLTGLRGIHSAEGEMSIAMPASAWLCNAFGVVYGGAIAYLADAAIILAAISTVPAGTAVNTIDLKVNFLRPVIPTAGELVAEARVIHRGRSVAVASCAIRDSNGKAVAQATGSVLLLPGRFWERPVQVADEMAADAGG